MGMRILSEEAGDTLVEKAPRSSIQGGVTIPLNECLIRCALSFKGYIFSAPESNHWGKFNRPTVGTAAQESFARKRERERRVVACSVVLLVPKERETCKCA